MNFFLLFFMACALPLFSVQIEVQQDKTSLYIDQRLTVNYLLHYDQNEPPELFGFLYEINHAPLVDFQIVSSSVDPTRTKITFTLSPKRTGTLLFAPGILSFGHKPYLVPAITADCLTSGISSLPVGRMLPLYPEKRIELSPEMRVRLFSKEMLQQATMQINSTFEQHERAWRLLVMFLLGIPLALLFLWGLIYFELWQMALKPSRVRPSPKRRLLQQVQDEKLPHWIRSERLSQLLRAALGPEYCNLDLKEVQQKVPSELREVTELLVESCYAGKELQENEWQKAKESVLSYLAKSPYKSSLK